MAHQTKAMKKNKRKMKKRRPSTASTMSDYCLDRLFDPEELFYVAISELVKRYKMRDLM